MVATPFLLMAGEFPVAHPDLGPQCERLQLSAQLRRRDPIGLTWSSIETPIGIR